MFRTNAFHDEEKGGVKPTSETSPANHPDLPVLSRVLNQRGYLVVVSEGKWSPGEITKGNIAGIPVDQPIFIICETSAEDFMEHRRAAGWPDEVCYLPSDKFYRVGTD